MMICYIELVGSWFQFAYEDAKALRLTPEQNGDPFYGCPWAFVMVYCYIKAVEYFCRAGLFSHVDLFRPINDRREPQKELYVVIL